jgi:MFS family permease
MAGPARVSWRPPVTVQTSPEPAGRWQLVAVLAAAVLLSLVPWFSAASVAPLIAEEWRIGAFETAMLTVAVQIGFAAGALGIAVTGAADVIPARRLIAGGALVAAAGNAGFALLATDLATAVPLRALSGAGIAAVYPVAMKVLAGWFARERGLAVGVLIGAITLGSAMPHAIRAVGAGVGLDWRMVVLAASASGILAAALAWARVREGPLSVPAARLSLRMARQALSEPSVRLANLGYLGHMWELYAMWTWVPLFVAASLAVSGDVGAAGASAVAFLVVAAGAIGCVAAGALADRLGRTTLTIAAMALSGTSAVAAGLLFGAPSIVLLVVVVVWGITVVADSAQFSTAISELSPPGTAGSALALQTSAGFLLTGVTIVGVGLLEPGTTGSWAVAFGLLALGPLVGIVAMWRLRGRPEAVRMAGGRR